MLHLVGLPVGKLLFFIAPKNAKIGYIFNFLHKITQSKKEISTFPTIIHLKTNIYIFF